MDRQVEVVLYDPNRVAEVLYLRHVRHILAGDPNRPREANRLGLKVMVAREKLGHLLSQPDDRVAESLGLRGQSPLELLRVARLNVGDSGLGLGDSSPGALEEAGKRSVSVLSRALDLCDQLRGVGLGFGFDAAFEAVAPKAMPSKLPGCRSRRCRRTSKSDAGERRLMVAIPAQRDRVPDSVVGRVAVDLVDLHQRVGAAAVATAAAVDREQLRTEPRKLSATGTTALMLATVGAVRQARRSGGRVA